MIFSTIISSIRQWLSKGNDAGTIEPEKDHSTDDTGARFAWCLTGNIIEHPYAGKDGQPRYGTRHFAPGTKVYCLPHQWGDGYEKIKVIGKHRNSNRSVCLVIPSKYIANWRLQKVYRTYLLELMSHHHHWTGRESDKQMILQMLEWLPEKTLKNKSDALWQRKEEHAVGGLLELGFQPGTDMLMVLSAQGRGIFDCISGQRVARDRNTDYPGADTNGAVPGFGPLAGERVTCGGFEYPNPLKQATADGWEVRIFSLPEAKNDKAARLCIYNIHTKVQHKIASFPYGIDRAYGFSDTGRSFIAGSSPDLLIWSRDI
ncbi:hypothetical protein [Taibaiella chishuiensis]|uniref:Uncharacterized protein n=1 Tax=Taibaiella chishuiensis TaxID=1434707 RepID=A0A2P8D666_9BACT|nr:hypothetical protein [Taibaiella chishuiensis]PSK92698.1 hypothetical protein B0I18_103280 [Taibaiella chishuiensis]